MSGSTVNANIPLSFAPTPGLGGDPLAAIRAALGMGELQEQRQQLQGQNALRSILSQPGAFGPGGVNPELLPQVAAADPNAAMKLYQNNLVTQQRQLQTDLLKSKAFETANNLIADAYAPLYETYQTAAKDDPAKAMLAAQEQLPEVNKRLTQSGVLTPQQQQQLLTQFDPTKIGQFVQNSELYRNWLTQQRQQEAAARAERHEQAAENVPIVGPDGKILSYNKVTRKTEPTELPAGAVPLSKAPAPGTAGATARDVRPDVIKEHPEWTPGQVDLEVSRRQAEAKRAPSVTAGAEADAKAIAQAEIDRQNAARAAEQKPALSPAEAAQVRIGTRDKIAEEKFAGIEKAKQTVKVLRPDTADLYAEQYLMTGQNPALGWGPAARNQVADAANALAKAQNLSVPDILAGRATYSANKSSLAQITKISDAVQGFENTALSNMTVAESLMNKGAGTAAGPVVNRWLQAGRRATGDKDVAAFNTAMGTVQGEYGKVISGGSASIAATPEGARTDAKEWLDQIQSPEALKEQFAVARQDMKNRRESLMNQRATIEERIRGKEGFKPGTEVAPAPPVPGPIGGEKYPQVPEQPEVTHAELRRRQALPHITSDAAGEAAFKKLKPGAYYIDPDGKLRGPLP